jgi:hypothetical protein
MRIENLTDFDLKPEGKENKGFCVPQNKESDQRQGRLEVTCNPEKPFQEREITVNQGNEKTEIYKSPSIQLFSHTTEGIVAQPKSSFPFEMYNLLGNRMLVNSKNGSDILEKVNKSKDRFGLNQNESALTPQEETNLAFTKHISKIKYFWRGTNFNYPYAFNRFYRICKKDQKSKSGKGLFWKEEDEKGKLAIPDSDSEGEDDHYLVVEEYSNKLINPADKFYK